MYINEVEMKITFLCSNRSHPVYPYLLQWIDKNSFEHEVTLVNKVEDIRERGDILFLISCSEIVKSNYRDFFRYSLVLHASDLPSGRGWNPHIWQVVNGDNHITLSLLNAEDTVDTGDIWKQKVIELNGYELYDEINDYLFTAELELIDWACENILHSTPHLQGNIASSYYRLRTPEDSQLDVNKSIAEQFNLLRVCDPNRFPAFFYIDNQKYIIHLTKAEE